MPTAKELADQLTSDNTNQRRAAAEQLCQEPDAAKDAATALAIAAADEDSATAEAAAGALEGIGAPNVADVPALAELLGRDDAAGYWSATLLGRLESQAAAAVGDLAAALAEGRAIEVRQRAAWALGKIGPAASDAEEALAAATAASDARLARLAKKALGAVR